MLPFLIVLIAVLLTALYLAKRANLARREKYLESYSFHRVIDNKLAQKYPQLTAQQRDLVLQGLRDYFLMCLKAKRKWVSMPSQAVDEAWHTFILSTHLYANFCRRGFGYFLHHTPAEAMPSATLAQDGIKRAWRLACARERISPRNPQKLPLIFALDGMLKIPDGFTYSLHCTEKSASRNGGVYCASDIGCASGCFGDAGSDAAGCGGDGGGCSGGCGGD